MTERLNKYLAFHLGTSRREADEAIAKGEVRINDIVATLGDRFHEGDRITYQGKVVATKAAATYLALHKPIGYVSSRKQQGEYPTLYSLLPAHYHSLKPVGRLDKDSSGLLLLTDDGDFAFEMTHPKFIKEKRYLITLDRPLEPLHQQMISDYGVELEDGRSQLLLEKQDDSRLEWVVIMHEGRNRQIRRTFAALGYTVVSLHRTQFGPYAIGSLKAGDYQVIDPRR